MIRTVKLLDYLPPFMREYREMQYIMTAEQPECQALCDSSETIKDNQFITTSNENGISRFEKMLGITPLSGETLSDRKAKALAKWIDGIPYTMEVLSRKLDVLFGVGNHTETLDNENFTISVDVEISGSSLIRTLDELLTNILPANLLWDTMYTGISDIEFETVLELYETDYPFCGQYLCGQWPEGASA
jgi:hypothetical protein